LRFAGVLATLFAAAALAAAQAALGGQVTINHVAGAPADNAGVVIWLTSPGAAPLAAPAPRFRMAQRNKKFEPHLLVIPVGSTVAFPNFDPYFHNVFSLGDTRPFDLGLYQAGKSRSRQFDRPGLSYVFCNIHPQMSAVILTVPSPWYAVSDAAGRFQLRGVPAGDYQLHVWYERARAGDLSKLGHPVSLTGAEAILLQLTVQEVAVRATHKNKYGQDYDTGKAYGGGGL